MAVLKQLLGLRPVCVYVRVYVMCLFAAGLGPYWLCVRACARVCLCACVCVRVCIACVEASCSLSLSVRMYMCVCHDMCVWRERETPPVEPASHVAQRQLGSSLLRCSFVAATLMPPPSCVI